MERVWTSTVANPGEGGATVDATDIASADAVPICRGLRVETQENNKKQTVREKIYVLGLFEVHDGGAARLYWALLCDITSHYVTRAGIGFAGSGHS